MDADKIAKFHAQVLVHLNATFLDIIGAQANENGATTFLSSACHVV
jgi:hypothetical protein